MSELRELIGRVERTPAEVAELVVGLSSEGHVDDLRRSSRLAGLDRAAS